MHLWRLGTVESGVHPEEDVRPTLLLAVVLLLDVSLHSDKPVALASSTGDFFCPPKPQSLQDRMVTLGNLAPVRQS